MKVNWTNAAIEHLLAIYEYISRDSPVYADRMIDRLTQRSDYIKDFSEAGRRVPEYDRKDIREVIETPYRIIYRIKKEQIDVLAVFHSRQQLPPQL
jgi:addiction module RelE/StbE family toxin